MRATLQATFESPPSGGQRLYLHHVPPAGTALRGVVVYVHPWAEEMNKSRRMASTAAQALAEDGWAVLQIDLLGCGDSSGDFGDATWDAWIQDVIDAVQWIQARHPQQPLWLWGLRAGALLAVQAAARIETPVNFLFWQPVTSGKTALQQFLRLLAAAQLADGGGKALLAGARNELAAGRAIHVAGYALGPQLAAGLEAASLNPTSARGQVLWTVVWLELSTQPEPALAPATQVALPRWQAAGHDVDAHAIRGPAFWQTTEIEAAPALVTATVEALSRWHSGQAADPSLAGNDAAAGVAS